MKPIVLSIHEMREAIVDDVNKYVKEVPAIVIVDVLKDLTRQLLAEDERQLEQAKLDFTESEDFNNGKQKEKDN